MLGCFFAGLCLGALRCLCLLECVWFGLVVVVCV